MTRHYNSTYSSRENRIEYITKYFDSNIGREFICLFIIIFTKLNIRVYILEGAIVLEMYEADKITGMANISMELWVTFFF